MYRKLTYITARTPSMLGESMGTLRLYELLRKVQMQLGRAGGCSLREFWNFTASIAQFIVQS